MHEVYTYLCRISHNHREKSLQYCILLKDLAAFSTGQLISCDQYTQKPIRDVSSKDDAWLYQDNTHSKPIICIVLLWYCIHVACYCCVGGPHYTKQLAGSYGKFTHDILSSLLPPFHDDHHAASPLEILGLHAN